MIAKAWEYIIIMTCSSGEDQWGVGLGDRMNSLVDVYKLRNGLGIPCVGYGTFLVPQGEVSVESVKCAIRVGYRHIDTAAIYKNEESVGTAIVSSGVSREEIFVTSKLWNSDRGYEKCLDAFDRSLKALGLDYLDLYLVHWPASSSQFSDWEQINFDTWKAMVEIYRSGRVKSIGVSNFMVHHLEALMSHEIRPMVNQIEFHPGFMQEECVSYCKKKDILIQAWGPLGQGKILSNPLLSSIAECHGKTVAQVCMRWCLQHEVLPLVKSIHASRIQENGDVFDFCLSDDEMKAIDSLPYIGGSGLDPDGVEF